MPGVFLPGVGVFGCSAVEGIVGIGGFVVFFGDCGEAV